MQQDWILNVLTDLKTFALANNLDALARQLDDTAIVALAEFAALEKRTHDQPHGDEFAGCDYSGKTGPVGRA